MSSKDTILRTIYPILLYKYTYTNQPKREPMLQQTKTPRINRTYTIEPKLYKEFKNCANKDGRVISRIIEQSVKRYVQTHS
jgi:hypothetical protein